MEDNEHLEKIEKLGKDIQLADQKKRGPKYHINSAEVISEYHEWRALSEDLFAEHFDVTNNHYNEFLSQPRHGNGYTLMNYFNIQYPISKILLNKIKNKMIPLKKKELSTNRKIFISHSTKNREVVSKFCDLILDNGLNIDTTKEIFNTSLEGSKPETGEDFKNCIKNQLENAKLVLQFISEEYKKSEVCLNEMGAAWVLCDNVFPLIIEENEYEIGFIHSTTQQIQLHNENHISKLIDDLRKKGIVNDFSVERLNQKIKEFVSWLKEKKKEKTTEIKEEKKVESTPISQISNDFPFYKINKLSSTFFLKDGKYCLIPDDITVRFLGGMTKKLNRIEIPNDAVPSHLGETIQSIIKGELWTNDIDKKSWLIYKNRRHLVDKITYQMLEKNNPAIIRALVSPDQLLQIIEGDSFILKNAAESWGSGR